MRCESLLSVSRAVRMAIVLAVFTAGAGCGSTEDQEVSCAYLEPCLGLSCNSCGWPPAESCRISDGILAEAQVPSSGHEPFFVLVDIEVPGEVPEADEKICASPRIVIRNPQGELLNQSLSLDQPASLCTPSGTAGLHTVELQCPDGFPSRVRYRISAADSRASSVYP